MCTMILTETFWEKLAFRKILKEKKKKEKKKCEKESKKK